MGQKCLLWKKQLIPLGQWFKISHYRIAAIIGSFKTYTG
jgi:hypothetical protein